MAPYCRRVLADAARGGDPLSVSEEVALLASGPAEWAGEGRGPHLHRGLGDALDHIAVDDLDLLHGVGRQERGGGCP